MWNDNETTQDLLGFQVHADLICSLVTDPKLLPLTVGIFGDWGGGKTSIMKMVETELNPESHPNQEEKAKYERVACLYFNGWLFEGYDDAKSAILSSILLQLGENKRFGPKIRDKVTSLLKSVNWMRLIKFGFKEIALPAITAYATGGASLIPALAGSMKKAVGIGNEKDEETSETPSGDKASTINWEELIKADKTPSGPMDVRSFRERFSEMIKEADIDSLVVLIDDLDRCSPERIIDNLEAIKLFLNVDHTAFVIGADPRIVRHAISVRYKPKEIKEPEVQDEAKEGLVTDYLEKLIQIPYHLPRLSPAEIETYMVLLFCLRDLSPENSGKCLIACGQQRTTNRYSVFGYAAVKEAIKGIEIPAQLSQSLVFCTAAAPLITEGLKGNPRQVKRFLNAFILRKQLALTANLASIRDDVLVKLMVLEYGHPNEFRQLFQWQAEQEGFPKQLKELEETILPPIGSLDNVEAAKKVDPQWATTFMLKWLAMEPRLSDIDLRDYFWIARDRLQTTLTGISMVSPLVRKLFEDLILDTPRRKTAIEGVGRLAPDEMVSLFDLLEQQILRHPDQKIGYDALRALIEGNIPGSPLLLARTLMECPADSIPPAVGLDVLTLLKAKPQFQETFQSCIEALASSNTKIGRAIKKSQT
jgi:hypothetical protein